MPDEMNLLGDSVFSLCKSLSPSRLKDVYEILLDFQGQYGAERSKRNVNKLGKNTIDEYVASLRLIGDSSRALVLEELVSKCSVDDSTLLVLALLASEPKPAPSFGSRVFPIQSTVSEERLSVAKPAFVFDDVMCNETTLHKTPSLGEGDIFLIAARRLREQNTGTAVKAPNSGGEVHPGVWARRRKFPPIRSSIAYDELTFIRNQTPPRTSRFPEPIQQILNLLMNGSSVSKRTMNNVKRNPDSAGLYRGPQDINQMSLRKALHIKDCIVCSKCSSGAITDDTLATVDVLKIRDVDKELEMRAAICGRLYENLTCFSAAYCNSPGRVLSAVAGFAQDLAQDYLMRVLDAIDCDLNFAAMRLTLVFTGEELKHDMLAVVKFLTVIERSSGSACTILDLLYGYLPKIQSERIVRQLFFVAFSPYVEMIWDWGFYASSVRDFGMEYFGTVLGEKVTDSEVLLYSTEVERNGRKDNNHSAVVPKFLSKDVALFILRAGRSRGLLEMIAPNHHLLNVQPSPLAIPLSAEFVNGGAFQLSDHIRHSHSSPLPDSLAAEMQTDACTDEAQVGGAIRELNIQEPRYFVVPKDDDPQSISQIQSAFSFAKLKSTRENSESQLGQLRVGSSSAPKTLVEERIVGILRRIDSGIQRAILNYFVDEYRVFDHLKVIGDLALLGAGDFAVVLVQQLFEMQVVSEKHERFIKQRVIAAKTFYGSTGPGGISYRKGRHLAACLQVALNVASARCEALSDNFHISVESDDINQTSLWDGQLQIEYDVSFPLTMIISPEALSLYSRYFNFFLTVQRAHRCLRTLYVQSRSSKSLRIAQKSRCNSILSDRAFRVRLWQFCWHAEHFVNIVGDYEFDQIHGISRVKFEDSWKNISSIWELRDAHMNFLNESLRRVLLGERQKSVMRVIADALKIIIDVEEHINDLVKGGEKHPRQTLGDLLTLIGISTDGIKRRSSFLVDVLEKLVASGSHPHLQDFLTRLNFNFYYKRRALF